MESFHRSTSTKERETYSESGETSEMLWEVLERGGEGEGPWAEPLGLEGGVKTLELNDAKMDDKMSRCSLDGCRLSGLPLEPAAVAAA